MGIAGPSHLANKYSKVLVDNKFGIIHNICIKIYYIDFYRMKSHVNEKSFPSNWIK